MVSLSSSLSLLDSLLIGDFQEHHHLLLISQHTQPTKHWYYLYEHNQVFLYFQQNPSISKRSLNIWKIKTLLKSTYLIEHLYITIFEKTILWKFITLSIQELYQTSLFNIYNYCLILVCIKGYIWDSLDQTCLPCNVGSYQGDGNSCIQCPEGQTTNYAASTSISQCRKSKKLIYI